MRSAASYKGHPLHPALIPFPFAFLTGAFGFDIAALMFGNPGLASVARYLAIAGIGAGVIAAIPGIIDYRRSVPPRSSGQVRARTHGLLNGGALLLFLASLWLRGDGPFALPAALAAEAIGAAALGWAGWMGGVLVNRNMMGVDHRFARAGKWAEARVPAAAGVIVAARADELEPGQMKLVHVEGDAGRAPRRIALARTGDGYAAFDDRCPHRGASLAGGVLVGSTVHCLWHGSQFDVESGALRCGPAERGVAVYPTRVVEGEVHVDLTPPRR